MVNGTFVYPPPFGNVGDYSTDIHVNLGSYMNITWSGGPSGTSTLWLFKDGNEFGTCTEFNLAYTFCTPVLLSFQSEQSYQWLVQTYTQNYTSAKPWYYFVIHSDTSSTGFYSHYFNIDPPVSSATTSATATSTSTSRSTSTGTSTATTITSTSTPTSSSSPTSSPIPSSNQPAGLSTGTKAAIGVAVGVGIPLLILLIYIAFMLARRRKPSNPDPSPPYTNVAHTRYNPDGTTSEYYEAPNDSYKPHGGYYQVQNPQSAGYKPAYQQVATSELSAAGRHGQAPMSELSGDSIRR